MSVLILVRHGESDWNLQDRFAGQVDVGLTAVGREEARAAGRWLRENDLLPAAVHTSTLSRAIDTVDELLTACGATDVAVTRTRRLDERHYGALQGLSRGSAAEVHGADQVAQWRRGIHVRPPLDASGRAESLADVRDRLRPYVTDVLEPELAHRQRVLVVSHGNTLRMLRQLVEGLSDEQVARSDIPTGGVRVIRPGRASRPRTGPRGPASRAGSPARSHGR